MSLKWRRPSFLTIVHASLKWRRPSFPATHITTSLPDDSPRELEVETIKLPDDSPCELEVETTKLPGNPYYDLPS